MLNNFSGATRIYPILGDPISQVKSPSGLTRAFEAEGHAIVVPLHVAPGAFSNIVHALSQIQNVDGFMATMPHKFVAFEQASSASERATMLRSANVVRRTPAGGWYADLLDGVGFVRASKSKGYVISGKRALLVGAGGAGGAIGLELLTTGVSYLAVHDTDVERRDTMIGKLAGLDRGRVGAGSPDPEGFDIVVNATPAGMSETDLAPVDLAKLRGNMLVGEVITRPTLTPLLLAAQREGCRTQSGIDMFDAAVQSTIDFFFGRLSMGSQA
ncbi:MAG: shikimate dehydrogenase [Tardiphaga sp.]|nr:shikimate dehydrogenase [Tardiphaga sp.]